MRHFAIFGAASAALLAACTATTRIDSGRIDRSYGGGGVQWDSGTIVYILAGAHEDAGMVAVCGAWMVHNERAILSHYHSAVLDSAIFRLGDERIVQGLGFMRRIDYQGSRFGPYLGQPAECVRTDVPWQPGYDGAEPTVEVPNQRIVL